jgi:hypothetical protein
VSSYTIGTGLPYSDDVLDECSIAHGRQNEPADEVDPRNTSIVIGSSNDYCGVYSGHDEDGFQTATGPNDGEQYAGTANVARGSSAPNFGGKNFDKTALAADHNSDGRCDNVVYFGSSRFNGNGNNAIYVTRSTDHGETWTNLSKLHVLPPRHAGPGHRQSGNDTCYSATRPVGNCASGGTVPPLDALASSSTDGGATWSTGVRLSDVTSNPNFEQFSDREVPFAGDYLWITSLGSYSFGTWADCRDTKAGTDPRETPEDEDAASADVYQCRIVEQVAGPKKNSPPTNAWSSDICPHSGGIDQNIYGDLAP